MNQTRIYIVGSGSSGNTLMRRLFYAFKDVEILRGEKTDEIKLKALINAKSDKPFIVAKRVANTIFSRNANMPKKDILAQVQKIQDNDIKVINMIRDGRDVVVKTTVDVTLRQWVMLMRQRRKYPEVIDLEVRYEDLVRDPDSIQALLVERYGLVPEHKFSEYPKFVPEHEWNTHQSRFWQKRPRPIKTNRIGKARRAYKKASEHPRVIKAFEEELKLAVYV